MATEAQIHSTVKTIKEKLDKILSYQIENLTREAELGALLSFKNIEPLFIKIIDLFKKVKDIELNDIPFNFLTQFNIQLGIATTFFDQVILFNANQGNPIQVRNDLIKNFQNSYDNYITHTIPLLTIGLIKGNDLSIEKAKLKSLINEIEREKENSRIESEKKLKEINEILNNAKSAASQVGVSKHSNVFLTESDEHKTESEKWLKYTIIILISIIIVSIILAIVGFSYNKSTTEILQFSITKVIILSALFYGLSITNKNYKAHKHNFILNKHRQNALSTFETFSKAAGDDIQTKNAILLETTHTIFSNQQTGYLQNENESDSPNKIIEIIKSVSTRSE